MHKSIKISGGFGLLIVLSFIVGPASAVGESTGERAFKENEESELNAVLMRAARQINQNLPMMVDAETRLHSTVGNVKQFRYNYTMIN